LRQEADVSLALTPPNDMNLDDESQLSAFLDDELDPGDRPVVAWSVESSPLLAQQLAEFQATQTLIQGLDRPSIPLDLSAAILTRITRANPPKVRRSTAGVARFAASLVGVASVAASLMLAIALLHKTLHQSLAPVVVADGADSLRSHPSDNTPPSAVPAPAANVAAVKPAAPLAPQPAVVALAPLSLRKQPQGRVVEPPKAADAELARPGQVDALLGHRKVVRALIITDALDQSARKVQAMIEQDGAREPDFGRITLARGIVIDPDQPGEAEVFSMVVNESGLPPFLDRLRAAFPSMTFAPDTEPTLVTQLTEVGQVAVFADVRPARLGLPPRDVQALVATKRAGASQDSSLRSTVVQVDPNSDHSDDLPTNDEARTQSHPPPLNGKAAMDLTQVPGGAALVRPTPRVSGDNEPVTVLVWVARAARP